MKQGIKKKGMMIMLSFLSGRHYNRDIEKKRKELYSITQKKGSLLDAEVLKKSRELDVLLKKTHDKR